ncbi:MAG: phosphoenolpyruvate synthase [Candidatus Buchananbacteria bacterium RBG_13_39_9]|uniref:Phosphoenolpyruvate synthase n=1 Tax=Candidatus Buchananbacteria bacterium RBG_13_39_9 TaxID=1797531 RepID=A0A1G1XQI2_9BACT|nr:MAG: phosphoenolpyruvate synthase [Candidatus Buchananbacteria bacterium RBG_13_39_9]
MKKYILIFSQVSIKDVGMVGGKNASLGEMIRKLTRKGIIIPDGFCTTAEAFKYFLEYNKIRRDINKILLKLGKNKGRELELAGQKIRQMVVRGKFPPDLERQIIKSYQELSRQYRITNVDVAVRSSATAEDLPTASFAGQQESYLNIKGDKELLLAIKRCFASLYTDRAISYRIDQKFKHAKVYLSVGIQKMIRSDLASAGVMFTIDTESGFKDLIIINSSYGLGENVVKGRVTPDEFFVYKPKLAIIKKELGTKKQKLIYTKNLNKPTKNILVTSKECKQFSLTDNEILQLAKWALLIEKHYKRPMDIEWAKDGRENKLYIVQARPETVKSQSQVNVFEQYLIQKKSRVLITGESIGQKIASGKVKVIKNVKELSKFQAGEILVTEMTDPDWEPIMKKAGAIVTDSGGRTCHAAIVSRELGVPAIVGAKNATLALKNSQPVTVSCAEGEIGRVYQGILPFKIKKTDLKKIKKPKVDIMMNLGDPTQAFKYSFLPNSGVGLARLEFIITTYVKIHPLALTNYHKLSTNLKNKIEELTSAYPNKTQFYIDQLAFGIAQIAAAFYPKDVIVRFSDFKTNEYANLIGGELYEPKEANPMIGWRGASRYYDPKFRPAFDLECQSIKKVRNEMGLTNVKVMIPFCRTVEEGKQVIQILKQNKLAQGKNGLEVYVMVEIPSNVILADKFAQIFDGFSIGSNDLTQLTLGLDRDSELISQIADERNEAVKILLKQAIKIAKQKKIKIGICGQAPSDFPDYAKFLMQEGIDSVSLNPDTVIKTTLDLSRKKG